MLDEKKCPKCGAEVDGDECEYCGTKLDSKECSRCGASVEGDECDYCGTKLDSKDCPNCGAPVEGDECEYCGTNLEKGNCPDCGAPMKGDTCEYCGSSSKKKGDKLMESSLRHNLWDRMMYRLLQEKKEKEVKASKSKGAKPDFLDLDKDGDKEEPMSKASKEAGGKKDTPKAKKGKGKIPPQLRMHIQKKKAKKSKIDEAIDRLEKILIEGLDEEQADAMLDEYGEEREPDQAEQDLDDDFDFNFDDEVGIDLSKEPEFLGSDFSDESDDDEIDLSNEPEFSGEDLEESVEYLSEAEVKKKQPRLGKVTRNPAGSNKKFHVYVKCGGIVKKISFGDPGLSIKRDSAARRKNFRARHKCDKPAGKDRCTARYWSCYQWRAGKKVEGEE
jgi:predicted amidophosphoribosyltransferase